MLNEFEWGALILSLKISTAAVLFGLPPALGAAWLLARREFPLKWLFDGLVHAPLVVPPVVVGYLLLAGFGRQSPIGGFLHDYLGLTLAFTWKGAALAAGVMAFPLMVRALRLSLMAVDRRLEAAARTLGARPWDVFFSVTLPLAAPGVLSAVVLGFARALGEFGATISFVSNIPGETRTLPIALYSLLQTPGSEGASIRLAMLSLVIALAALALSEYLARRLRVSEL